METKEVQETKETQKVTLEQLIKKKLEKDRKINATKEVFVKSLNANITVKCPTDKQRIEFLDTGKSGDHADTVEAYSRLLYDCCPMLHSKDLQDKIEVVYPYDTVNAIFDIDEIIDIGLKVLSFFGNEEDDDSDEKLKN